MILRRFRPKDLPEIADLFSDTIYRVNSRDYTPEQVRVWAAGRDRLARNPDFFRKLYTMVAVKCGKIVGYGDIDDTGYLDRNLDRLLELARTCERLTDDREAEE